MCSNCASLSLSLPMTAPISVLLLLLDPFILLEVLILVLLEEEEKEVADEGADRLAMAERETTADFLVV